METLTNICPLKCELDTGELIVQNLYHNYYAVLYNKDFHIYCYNNLLMQGKHVISRRLIRANTVKDGTMIFHLGCLCRLYFPALTQIIDPDLMCRQRQDHLVQDIQIQVFLPMQWVNLTTVTSVKMYARTLIQEIIHTPRINRYNYSKSFHWNLKYIPLNQSMLDRMHEHILTYHPFYSQSLLVAWNLAISIFIFYLWSALNGYGRAGHNRQVAPIAYSLVANANPVTALSEADAAARHLLFLIIVGVLNIIILLISILIF